MMNFRVKMIAIVFVPIALLAALLVTTMPKTAFAAAGPGGGGGTSGCSVPANTCYGAVWRYRLNTTPDGGTIKNVQSGQGGGGSTVVSGCSVSGGYFEYVLVTNANNPDTNPNSVRAWKIGNTQHANARGQLVTDNVYRSEMFGNGGATHYRVASAPGDTLPANLTDGGNYSWFAVQDAFAQTKAAGQNSGYSWNDTSELGWFCYRNINFSLTPTISTNPNSAVTAGGTVNVNGVVSNAGPTRSSNVSWQISQIIVPKGQAVPTASGDSNRDPRSFYGGSGFSTVDSGSTAFGVGTTNYSPRVVTVPDLPVGTKLCYVLSVNPYNQSTGDWRHSRPTCIVVAKRPITEVLGGDLRVGAAFVGNTAPVAGSNIQTSITIKTGKSYGSWGEYGLVASGTITGMASGSAYSGGLPCTSGCATNNISFTNSNSPIGKYKVAGNIPDVASSFGVNSATPQFSSLGDAALKRVETSNTDITISGGTIQAGQWLVINAPTKTVTITGDITYADTDLSTIADIPQLVIIANKINIEGNVGQVDAWLVASGAAGTVNTCSAWSGAQIAPTASLTSGICNKALVINGPVMAKTLYLRRTAGADSAAQIGDPAEVINLRPDAFLWATAQASKSARLETTYTEDLPPRF